MFKKRLTKKNGFTLVETLIAMFIIILIGLAIVNFQLDIFSLNKITNNNLVAQEDARGALKTMSSEIRSMSPSSLGAYPLMEVSTSTLTFYTDTDDDSLRERVRYFLTGTTLKRGQIKPTGNPLIYNSANETTKELIHNVANATSSIFSYYDTTYDGTSSALPQPVNILPVRLIKINVIIDDNLLKSTPPLNMTTQISIRNLKDNL